MKNSYQNLDFYLLTDILELKYDETSSYDERVQKRYNYVKEQLEKDPNYEGWDYPEYYKFKYTGEIIYLNSFNYIVSTNGKFAVLDEDGTRFSLCNGSRSGPYREICIRDLENKRIHMNVHRVLACTFIMNGYKVGVWKLFCNHKDLNKHNDTFVNLEWTTPRDNIIHAWVNEAHKTPRTYHGGNVFIGKYILDDEYEGKIFSMDGSKGLIDIGLDPGLIISSILGNSKCCYGFIWSFGVPEDLTVYPYIPIALASRVATDVTYTLERLIPILGKIIETSETFVLYGRTEISDNGFSQSPSKVFEYSKTGKPYKGCIFKRVSRLEGNKHQRGLTRKQIEFLNLNSIYANTQ